MTREEQRTAVLDEGAARHAQQQAAALMRENERLQRKLKTQADMAAALDRIAVALEKIAALLPMNAAPELESTLPNVASPDAAPARELPEV